MKPLSEWSETEITSEIGRYEDRKEWLQRDFDERIKSTNEGIQLLEADLVRRRRAAAESVKRAVLTTHATDNHYSGGHSWWD